MNLNLGFENLNQYYQTTEQHVSLEGMTADALDVMYVVFGNTNRDLLDRFVAKATGNSYEALHNLSLTEIQEVLMNKMMQESSEGFFKNAWSGIKFRFASYTSMMQKLIKAEQKIKAVSDEEFKHKKLGVKLSNAKDLLSAMNTAHKICFQTMNFSVTDEIKVTSDTTSAEISAQCEKVKNRLSKMVEDANEITDNLEVSRMADQTAADIGYTKNVCLKICSYCKQDFIKAMSRINSKAWEVYFKQMDAFGNKLKTLGYGKNGRLYSGLELCYGTYFRAMCAICNAYVSIIKQVYKLADSF